MKNKLFKMFCAIFEKELNLLKKQHGLTMVQENRRDNYEQMEEMKRVEMFDLVGKPIICISNEWTNPSVGFVKDVKLITQSKNPVLIIKDYITNEEHMVLGKHFEYTKQRLDAILKLDPFEACSLIYNYTSGDFEKDKSGIRDTKEVIMQKLIENGFFEKLENQNKEKNKNKM